MGGETHDVIRVFYTTVKLSETKKISKTKKRKD